MNLTHRIRTIVAASVAALMVNDVSAHVSYSGRDFGTFAGTGAEAPKVITIGNVSSSFGWAAATDADFGDSHRTRAFRLNLTNPAVVTLRVQGATVGATPALPFPGFSIYKGLCHVAPQQSDHDASAISANYLATLGGVQPKAGALIALGDFRIGNDPTYNVSGDPNSGILYPAELSQLFYVGHAADGTSANYGSAAGIEGDGTADNDVVKSFVLPAGDYSIFIGGGDYSTISNGPTWPNYGITATLSVAAIAAPTVAVPSNITTAATGASGAVVNFTVSATDAAGKALVATPSVASGSTFPVGTTTVNVNTVDAAGQTGSASFTVTVNASTDATLSSLAVSGASLVPAFDPNTTSYTATVGNAVSTATISAPASFSGATVQQTPANPVALNVGGNNISVLVTAQDGSTTKTYTVNVKRTVADAMKPVVKITAPGASVTGAFTISGTVSEAVGLSTLKVSLNGSAPQSVSFPTDTGAAIPWSVAGVLPENGVNTIVVEATDYNGNVASAAKSTVYLNTTLGATVSGSYNGVIVPAEAPSNDTSGFITVAVDGSAAFSGKVSIGGVTIPISGVLNNAGQAKFKPSFATTLALIDRTEFDSYLGSLSFSVAPGAVTGVIDSAATGGIPVASVTAKKNYFDGKTGATTVQSSTGLLNATTKGIFNAALASKEQTPPQAHGEYPQGAGATSITLMANGTVAVKGNLADGTAFSASGRLAQDYSVALYAPLYRKVGSIAGSLKFDTAAADTDVADVSDLLWVRPPVSRAQYYPAGFTVYVDAIGTKYAGTASAAFGQGNDNFTAGNASLVFTGGALSGAVNKAVNVSESNGAVKLIPAAAVDYKFTLSAATGLFSGYFTHSDSSKPAFRGVLLNKSGNQRGLGYFLSTPAASARSVRLLAGAATIDYDKTAWDSLAAGFGLGLPVLTLDEFFNAGAASSRTLAQLIGDEIQANPSYVHQHYPMNPAAVTNLSGRTNKPTTFAYSPGSPESHIGAIGLGGVARFATALGGILYGDFTLQYDATRQLVGGSGWYLKGNIPPAGAVFDLTDVNVVEGGGLLSINGDLTVSYEIANFLYATPADTGKDVGNFSFNASVSAPSFGASGQGGAVVLLP